MHLIATPVRIKNRDALGMHSFVYHRRFPTCSVAYSVARSILFRASLALPFVLNHCSLLFYTLSLSLSLSLSSFSFIYVVRLCQRPGRVSQKPVSCTPSCTLYFNAACVVTPWYGDVLQQDDSHGAQSIHCLFASLPLLLCESCSCTTGESLLYGNWRLWRWTHSHRITWRY